MGNNLDLSKKDVLREAIENPFSWRRLKFEPIVNEFVEGHATNHIKNFRIEETRNNEIIIKSEIDGISKDDVKKIGINLNLDEDKYVTNEDELSDCSYNYGNWTNDDSNFQLVIRYI